MLIENIITSRAKLLCLKTIFNYQRPIHLRRLVNLTGLQPRSVQLALESLKTIKLLRAHANGNKIEYSLNKNSSAFSQIENFINELTQSKIKIRSETYPNLIDSLSFIDDAKILISSIKERNELK